MWPASGPVGVKAEAVLSLAWTDITGSLRGGTTVTVTRPRSAEQAKAATAQGAFTLDSVSGSWVPGASPAPADWGLSTPVRLSVDSPANYLRLPGFGGVASSAPHAVTPDATTLHVTGSIELRIQLRLADWRPSVLAARYGGSGTPSWIWGILADGTMQFGWFDSANASHSAVSTAPVPFGTGTMALRVTLNTSTGAATFYTAPTIDGTYTQLGSAITGAATSIAAGNQELDVGWSSYGGVMGMLCGQVDAFRMYNGIGGTIVANPVFSSFTATSLSGTDSAGRSWSWPNGEISNRDYRHHGCVATVTPGWATAQGGAMSLAVQTSGVLDHCLTAAQAVRSPVRRYYDQQSLVALWPLESGTGVSQMAEVVTGLPANEMGYIPVSGDSTSFPACQSLTVVQDTPATFTVPTYTPGAFSVLRWLANVTNVTTADSVLMDITINTGGQRLQVLVEPGGSLRLRDLSGGTFDSGYASYGGSVINRPCLFSLELSMSGSTVQARFVVMDANTGAAVAGGGNTGFTGGTRIGQGSMGGTTLTFTAGMVAVMTGSSYPDVSALVNPLAGWANETDAARFGRLCGEDGIASRIVGSPAGGVLMGFQPPGTLTDLLQECEDAGGGITFEPRDVYGLAYRTRATVGSITWLAVPSYLGYLDTGTRLTPKLANTYTVNDVTVTRTDGSGIPGSTYRTLLADGSPMSVNPTSRPPNAWTAKVSVNLANDTLLPANAAWRLKRGTDGSVRWPVLPFALTNPQLSSLVPALRAMDIGDRLTVATMPDGFAGIDQLAWGLTETLGGRGYTGWDVSVNTVSTAPWT